MNLRLVLDGGALVSNWRALDRLSGNAAAAAVVKANGYGLGAREVAERLWRAGCRAFFVSHWSEAAELHGLIDMACVSVLHGVAPGEEATAQALGAIPVLNSLAQIERWRAMQGGLCHVMIDTGMNRLGLADNELGAAQLDQLNIDLMMSHLACADTPLDPANVRQRASFQDLTAGVRCARRSLANSAGIALGMDYHFDLTRPGVSLYGGVQCAAHAEAIAPVVHIEARVLQIRQVSAGQTIGYGGAYQVSRDMRVGTIALGYADGYKRAFAGAGSFRADGIHLPTLGRISMDLTCVDLSAAPDVLEGDWIAAEIDMAAVEMATGMAQYEFLTHLGSRFDRVWRD